MTYRSGFCGMGQCEGTAPVSYSGKPMKVCIAYEVCTCDCHAKFDRMYKMANMPREVHQNPNYVPVEHPSYAEYFTESEELFGQPIGPTANTQRVLEKPSEVAPGLLESARSFTPTPSGYRQRGQLEVEVQQICNRAMMGEFEERMTPQFIAQLINPDNPPSTGAIGSVFNRWEKIGYAKIHRKPLYFQRLTVEGMRDGLEALKRKAKR